MNKYLKKLLPLYYAATLSLGIVASNNATAIPFYADSLQTNESDIRISPQSNNIIWIVKTENGKTYKRQYNCSTGEWIGDWILVP